MTLEELKYPIGKFESPKEFSAAVLNGFIDDIESFPSRIQNAVLHLDEAQLETTYRPDGWTVKQVVNHCADSHMNGLIRLKLGLTEIEPTIKPYKEALWAELPDGKILPLDASLNILKGVHSKWAFLLKSLDVQQFARKFFHPESEKNFSLFESTALYAWHGNHHLGHITTLVARKGW